MVKAAQTQTQLAIENVGTLDELLPRLYGKLSSRERAIAISAMVVGIRLTVEDCKVPMPVE